MSAVISVKNLSLNIGGAKILNDLNIEVKENETFGIIGPNGAGKTTLFNLLSGIYAPTTGQIFLGEQNITKLPPFERTRLGLARTFQTSSIFPNLTLLENVRIAAQSANGHSFNITRNAYKYREVIEKSQECLDQVGLGKRSFSLASALSHGDKRRLEIAIVLALDSHVVMLDEPMAGMSVENVPALVELIRSLAKIHNKTVLIVEHHMEVILDLADLLAVLNYGELLVVDTPNNVIANPIVQSAYLGESL